MSLVVKIVGYDGTTWEVTDMVKTVKWGGDVNTLPRKLEVTLNNATELGAAAKRIININVGYMAFLFLNDQELFRGFIFNKSINQAGEESITAFDELIYATKSMDTILVVNQLASDVINGHMVKFGIPVGSIQPTTYRIPKKLFQNQTLASIWQECLIEEKNNTGAMFQFFAERGLSYLWTRENAAISTVNITDIISGSNEVSIEELRNYVAVTKGSLDPAESTTEKMSSANAWDPESIKNYGYLVHYESASGSDASLGMMQEQAKNTLLSLNKPLITSKIEFIGNPNCVTGRLINIEDKLTGLTGTFFITNDEHSWEAGSYKMSLQISKDIDLHKKTKSTATTGGGVKWR